MQLSELDGDLKQLKAFARRQDKIAHKRDVLLPKWQPIVDKYLADVGSKEIEPSDHPIFARSIIWLFDVGDFGRAIELGFKAIELGQAMAAGIRRQWPSFIADTVFEWCEIQAEQGHSVEPYFSQVFSQVAQHWQLAEPITAKFYKFKGLNLLRSTNGEVKATQVGDISTLQQADALLEKAASLHKGVGVKTVRNKIEMRIRALEAYGSQEPS
ncbi:terminase [Shewanella sp. VB17]|uniref:phage terminase small subunit n=1 Tax=Shewanella sp. VB17 TaxID=2739432 RepID=UPI0015653C64|nr:phage terminase small subunit [Shewanella sp. VB17]NRD73253.1 terminase [Shewanella sp. VB17]